jgi:Uma2 family endonuclease
MTQAAPRVGLLTMEAYLVYDDGTNTRYELVDGKLVEMPVKGSQCKLRRYG